MILRGSYFLLVPLFLAALPASMSAQEQRARVAEILQERPNLSQPARRGQIVAEIRRVEEERKAAAVKRALAEGLPIRTTGPGHQVAELMDFIEDQPLYAVTTNREAAISTAANTVRLNFGVDGSGFAVGVWDGGSVLASHQEFVGRVNVVDAVDPITHATHVAGIIAAAGKVSRAAGMSPGVSIDSYDWNSDKSEMTARGASYPNEAGTLYLSNHSYGFRSGWSATGASSPQWEWRGQGTNQSAVDANFGKYSTQTRDMDALAYNLPYYSVFWAAGNDRTDNPAFGASVRIGGSTTTYNSAVHPPGDGVYKNGYDTLGFESLAKNVVTVGSVNDAVSLGNRDLARASISSFSVQGPTDDGRIKPDLVANGSSLYSPTSGTNTSYGNLSGTSMATPNAVGSAQLLVSYFDQQFPGHAMRASTLKALLVHTADDLGRTGPDYQFGWGLLNTEAAAAQIAAHAASPGIHRMVEAQLTAADVSHSYAFFWDGFSPVRATLCWIDPAGSATTNHDDRTRRLINNLDLEIEGPAGTVHQPYVMPFVGDWSQAALTAPATTGKNNTDNVLQVFIAAPPAAGIYTAKVTFDGTLTHNAQNYSLILSGNAGSGAAPPPDVASISPETASSSLTTMTLTGGNFQLGATATLRFPGEADRPAFGHEIAPDRIKARFDTEQMAGGLWDVVVTNPDGQLTIFPAGFAVAAPFWSENFESGAPGWSVTASPGTSNWTLSEETSRSPTHSFFTPGAAAKRVDNLVSPSIEIPADASDLSFSFWHRHQFAANQGGVLEFSLDGGAWFDPSASGSGASFVSGSYNGSVAGKGKPTRQNPLGDRAAWTGTQSAFSEVIITLDASAFSGKALRFRWRLGSNQESSSPGWFVDDVVIQGAGAATFPTPQITVIPTSSASPVIGTSVDLNLEAENSDRTGGLTYSWTVNDSFEFPISFSENGTVNASSTTATFARSGNYQFEVTVRNDFNQTTSSSLDLLVESVPTAVSITPNAVVVPVGTEITLVAAARDQFDLPLDPQPIPTWTIDPLAGVITQDGLLTAAPSPGGPFLVTASFEGGLSGNAEVTIRNPDYTDWQSGFFAESELLDLEASGEAADPDWDGVPNLLEYALGGDPRQPNRGVLPETRTDVSEQGVEMVFSFVRPTGLSDIDYLVESSADFVIWNPVSPASWQTETVGETEWITIRSPLSERLFLRLQVTRP